MLEEVKDKNIKETGERMIPAFHKGALVYGEHITRYESVVDLLKDKEVLDIASGSGYGSAILAEKAKKIYGVDVDADSVAYARKNYKKDNVEFIEGSAEAIPLDDNSVDVVVTFETIEHIQDYKKFLDEIKRVLRPDGFAIVSTPNDIEFPEGNHFHLHEFKQKELDDLLKQYFKNVHFSYQYTWLFAGLMEESKAANNGEIKIKLTNEAAVTKEKAIYFMAICSDEQIDQLRTKELGAISEHWSARQVKEAEERVENSLKEVQEENHRLSLELVRTNANLQNIYDSKRWRTLSAVYDSWNRFTGVFRRK